jgi:hypothetical protein
MMEAASTSRTSVNFYQTHGATTQTAIFILAAVRTSNLAFTFCTLLTKTVKGDRPGGMQVSTAHQNKN